MKFQIIKAFEPLFKGALADKRILIYYGGRGGGKSDQLTLYFILQALNQKNINILILRESSKANINSVIANFKKFLIEFGLSDIFVEKKEPLFKVKATSIECLKTNSKIIFTGVNDKTVMSLKSFSNIKYCWIEEANYLTQKTWELLVPTIRAEKSQIILSLNPQNIDEFVWSELISKDKENPRKYIKRINYYNNPYFPEVLNDDREADFHKLPRDMYLNKWLGEPLNYNEMQCIDISKIGRFDDTEKVQYDKVLLIIDSAFSIKASADYSVVSVFGYVGDEVHLLRLERGRWEFATLVDMVKGLYFWAMKEHKKVERILIEAKASGQSLIQELRRLTNLAIYGITPTADKFTRLNEVISNLDKLRLPFSDNALNYWVKDFLQECKLFRADMKHEHDDMVDCMIYALKELNQKPVNWSELSKLI